MHINSDGLPSHVLGQDLAHGDHLAGDVVPLHKRAGVQDLIADKLKDVGVQLLQGLWQLAIRACRVPTCLQCCQQAAALPAASECQGSGDAWVCRCI